VPRWFRTPQTTVPRAGPGGRRAIARFEAGNYLGCPACGRLIKIEWAVRSLVCSCGARVPVTARDGKNA
jgi:hypothetical protein